jgi:hypothetical protein
MQRVEGAARLVGRDPERARRQLQNRRRRALRLGAGPAATARLHALRMVLSEEE